jgi:hypothetical protein
MVVYALRYYGKDHAKGKIVINTENNSWPKNQSQDTLALNLIASNLRHRLMSAIC